MSTKIFVTVGTSILIERSSGRIQAAKISNINYVTQLATVEWVENEIINAKDVDFSAIARLNTNMAVNTIDKSEEPEVPPSTIASTRSTALNRRQTIRRTINEPILSFRPKVTNVMQRDSRQMQSEEKAEKEALIQRRAANIRMDFSEMVSEYRKTLTMNPLSNTDAIENDTIKVCVRKRPMNKQEINRREVDIITIPTKNQLILHEPKTKLDLTRYLENQFFRFDYAFDETCSNEMVYRYTAMPLIKTIFEGGFATCFAYGQTGCGKTHTMGGDFSGKNQDFRRGIYFMAASDIFHYINTPKYRSLNLIVTVSFFEIYSEKAFDLLNNKAKLRIMEDGKQQVQVVGLAEKVVVNVKEVLGFIEKGNKVRTSGHTAFNSNSSRSHAIFQIVLRNSNCEKIHGKFSLIDLAGNERGAGGSSADQQTRMVGAEINKSLLALKECIRALGRQGSQHVPFRGSKLTQVLRDSFVGGKSKTCMIAMISPGTNSCEQTLNTLRYADRVKELGVGDESMNLIHDVIVEDDDALDEIQLLEEKMLDDHKSLIRSFKRAEEIYHLTDKATYNKEEYCKKMKDLFDEIQQLIEKSKGSMETFTNKLGTEE